MDCPGLFHCFHIADYVIFEHTSFHVGLCGGKFGPCLFGGCPAPCTTRHSWQHALVVYLSHHANGKEKLEERINLKVSGAGGIYKTIVTPQMMYGADTLTMKKEEHK